MADEKKLYTLTAIAKMADVSMPTLQRYKKLYQDRIPSVGEGRKQRYPESAVKVIEQIKAENLKKRGRAKTAGKKKVAKKKIAKKKTAAARKRTKSKKVVRKKVAARKKKAASGAPMLSLAEIGRRTGISYPTLISYVKKHGSSIPHQGTGRKRRFPEEAVAVFEELRSRSGRRRGKAAAGGVRGRSAEVTDAALARRVKKLEAAQREIGRQLDSVIRLLKKPMQVTIRPR